MYIWETEHPSGLHSMLLENGNMLIGCNLREESQIIIGGKGGKVQEYDWDGVAMMSPSPTTTRVGTLISFNCSRVSTLATQSAN